MNPYIAKILYHTHDKWSVDVKHRDDLIKLLEFCITHEKFKTERLLKTILSKVEEGNNLLITKGLIEEFKNNIPEVMRDYFIVYDTNKLIKYYKEDDQTSK